MKHGKKSEQKSARTESKKSGKAGRVASPAKKSVVAAPRASAKSSGSKAAAAPPASNGKRVVAAAASSDFTNAAVGTSFHRAVKKYANAFRRLTD
jgi:hypothetical protein